MASAFSHAVVAATLGTLSPATIKGPRFWTLSVLCSVLPDADVVGFAFGIEYGDLFGHRGITHSFIFAAMLSVLVVQAEFAHVTKASKAWWLLTVHFFLVTASHGVLDAMTDGGLGVAFFAPMDPTRYFLPWTPVKVSPIGVTEFFSAYGARVLASEIVWIWIPSALIISGAVFFSRTRARE